jgi:hypothetical protein
MPSSEDSRYTTRVETNRWESFTRLSFIYFADQEYDVEQNFDVEEGRYVLTFTDEDRDESAVFVYEGGPPDMAQESLQQMQKLLEGSSEFWSWTDAME